MPILLVHRALVRAYRLGEGGLTDEEAAAMEVTGELISNLERRAMVAERETMDRYVAAFLADQVGAVVDCRITGVQPFGFFATVEGLGGDGLVPAAGLGDEYFRYEEAIAAADRRRERRGLCARPAAEAAAGRGRSGQRRAALRACRTPGRDRPRAAAPRPARAGPARPARQYPPSGTAAMTERGSGTMTQQRQVAVIVGSLREGSLNRKVARAIEALAPDHLVFEEIGIGDLPLYNQDLDGDPPAEWIAFRDAIRPKDALLFVTPEYNRSIPGVLKNAIDVGSRPYGKSVWAKKPAAVISASLGTYGGFGANHHLRQSCVFLDVPLMPQPEAYLGRRQGREFRRRTAT